MNDAHDFQDKYPGRCVDKMQRCVVYIWKPLAMMEVISF